MKRPNERKLTLLLVDDEESIRDSFLLRLRPHFEVGTAPNAEAGMTILKKARGRIPVAIVDMVMDDDAKAGLKMITQIRNLDQVVESVVLTAYGTMENAAECMEAGAFSYVEKGRKETTRVLIETVKRAAAHQRFRVEEARMLEGVVDCLAMAVDSHEPYTAGHSRRVGAYAKIIAEEMNLSPRECSDIELAGKIHDIGKLGIDICTLARASSFTNVELAMIRAHPLEAERILRGISSLRRLARPLIEHHEWFNGRGYPNNKKGKRISLMGRILALADAFDAMTSTRPYQAKRAIEDARREIVNPLPNRKGQFDPEVVATFDRCFDRITEAAKRKS